MSDGGGSRPNAAPMRATGGNDSPVDDSRASFDGRKTCSGGASATTSPSRMTTIRSKTAEANSMSCEIPMTDRPASRYARTTSPTRSMPSASWPVVGSSSTSTAGSIASTPARATSFRRDRSRSYGYRGSDRSEPDGVEAGGHELGDLGRRAAQVPWTERDLAFHGPFEELVVGVLEDEAHDRGEAIDGRVLDGFAVDHDAPFGGPEESDEVLDQGRLARAVLAEDRHRFAGLDRKGHALEGLDAVGVAMMEVLDLDPDPGPPRRRVPRDTIVAGPRVAGHGCLAGHGPVADRAYRRRIRPQCRDDRRLIEGPIGGHAGQARQADQGRAGAARRIGPPPRVRPRACRAPRVARRRGRGTDPCAAGRSGRAPRT